MTGIGRTDRGRDPDAPHAKEKKRPPGFVGRSKSPVRQALSSPSFASAATVPTSNLTPKPTDTYRFASSSNPNLDTKPKSPARQPSVKLSNNDLLPLPKGSAIENPATLGETLNAVNQNLAEIEKERDGLHQYDSLDNYTLEREEKLGAYKAAIESKYPDKIKEFIGKNQQFAYNINSSLNARQDKKSAESKDNYRIDPDSGAYIS